ncbi:hypothetical protein GGX14DRAFT_556985 [Mycena pura]|uniref:Uncharacterized protein n=1 Tax=Mycena pura TaxID=153505 RepID=A0AAD7E1M4_9AGAR|nr:hypothetical protein GGX14DRAFT_556985 [Mycena pura]
MSTISESSLSLVASTLPQSSSTQTMLLGFLTLAFAGSIMYCASPMRLTNVLVAAMANAEKTYLEALEIGALDFHTVEMMASLQSKVSSIRETTLRNSLSRRTALGQFLTVHIFTLVQCIHEIRGLETHIEV